MVILKRLITSVNTHIINILRFHLQKSFAWLHISLTARGEVIVTMCFISLKQKKKISLDTEIHIYLH